MSVSYWMIYGIGLSMDDLSPYLDSDKVLQKMAELKGLVLETAETIQWGKTNDTARLAMLREHLNCSFGFADLIAESDSHGLLSYGNDGEDANFLYYEPSYPWQQRNHECQTEEAVRTHICDVVMPFVNDNTTRKDILTLIDQISQVGMG